MNPSEKYNRQISWLLEGDASIRYQTYRDLLQADMKILDREQENITKTGWGKQILDLQDASGKWGNGFYSPKWISTFYTLLLLKRFGAKANEKITKACMLLLDQGFYTDFGINYWQSWKQGETCVTGMLLSMLSHFGIDDPRVDKMTVFLIREQMNDGGWNCDKYKGATHSSFHTTTSVLEGFHEYRKFRNKKDHPEIIQKQKEGTEFLLQHKLYQSHRTGETVDPKMVKLAFPPRWKHDILKCLDLFREMDLQKDDRMQNAIEIIKRKQTDDGFWKQEYFHQGKIHFRMESTGKPGRWNTLRVIRVLKWWERI